MMHEAKGMSSGGGSFKTRWGERTREPGLEED